jgi:hypothetical protein
VRSSAFAGCLMALIVLAVAIPREEVSASDCHALEFDGLGDCALVPGDPVFDVQEHTLEVWARIYSHPYEQVIVGSRAGDARWDAFSLWSRGQRLCSSISDGTTNIQLLGTGDPLPLGELLHLAVTYDGEYLRTFVNGVQKDSLAWSGVLGPASGSPVTIGVDWDPTENFHDPFFGWLDEVRIWSRALGSSELAAPLTPPFDGNLVALWAFEEELDSQYILDSSPNSQTGHLGEFDVPDAWDPSRVDCVTPAALRSWGYIKAVSR